MAPRKRKQDEPEQQEGAADQQPSREDVARRASERLKALDRAVEDRCQAIADAAQEMMEAFLQDFQIRLKTGIPKQVREMPWAEYAASRAIEPASAAEAHVDSLLQEAQEVSAQTVAAACTARGGRAPRLRRGAAAAGADGEGADGGDQTDTAAPETMQKSRRAARQPVPKFDAADCAGPSSEGVGSSHSGGLAVLGSNENAAVVVGGGGGGGSGALTLSAAAAAAEARAKARVEAKLAALGAGATICRRGGPRVPAPGEQVFSQRGSPLSVLAPANGRAGRGAAAQPQVQVGLTPAPAPANTSAVGCFTLLKCGTAAAAGAVTGAAAAGGARGRGGRGRRREVVQPDTAAIMVTTADGQSFMVDGGAGSLAAIPESHRAEVQNQLVLLQRLAASVLGATVGGGGT